MAGGIAGVVAESAARDPAPSDDPLSFIAFGASCRA
jgi:hypothetical protein